MTGAGQGLGRAFALSLHAEDARVVIADLNRDRAESVCAELGTERALAVEVDVSAADSVQHLREVVLATFGTVDVLVNNAAIFSTLTMRPFDEIPVAEWDQVMAVNVRGAFLVSKYALPLMRPHGGAILHLSSGVATTGTRNRAAYTASKGAILSLTRNMALDYAADKVRVNCLCPGFVNTPLLASMPLERRAKLAALHPLGRMGEPEDLVPMALLLISDQSQWITGQAKIGRASCRERVCLAV